MEHKFHCILQQSLSLQSQCVFVYLLKLDVYLFIEKTQCTTFFTGDQSH